MISKRLSFFLTTTGRPTLINMLNSLKTQLDINDTIYIFVDGQQFWTDTDKQVNQFVDFSCNLKIIHEKDNLGYWGHGIRNKYQHTLNGDYILHCDDDDIYTEDAVYNIKKSNLDQEHICLFKFYTNFNKKQYVWKKPIIKYKNLGTPSGVIPNVPSKFGEWGYRYGGDFIFYSTCKFKYRFIDEIIYVVKPPEII